MKRMVNFIVLGISLLACCLGGCGGGGGSQPATAVVTLKTTGSLPAGVTALSGAAVDLAIPFGATVATNSGGAVQSSALTPTGMLSGGKGSIDFAFASYSAPTQTKKGSLKFVIIATDNTSFTIGDFAQVTCGITGTVPVAADFGFNSFKPADLSLNPVTVTPGLSLSIH